MPDVPISNAIKLISIPLFQVDLFSYKSPGSTPVNMLNTTRITRAVSPAMVPPTVHTLWCPERRIC